MSRCDPGIGHLVEDGQLDAFGRRFGSRSQENIGFKHSFPRRNEILGGYAHGFGTGDEFQELRSLCRMPGFEYGNSRIAK
ncbi:hypothetical protein D3C73_1200980 [compost metagenome]